MMKYIFCFTLFIALSVNGYSQKDLIEKVWYNQEKSSKIQIYKAIDGKFYGKIVWLAKPNNDKGELRTDINNPEEVLRQQPLQGLIILKGFEKSKENNFYIDGTIYDPNNGKKYCGKITLADKTLKLRGSICGLSFLGRSSTWTLAE
jgi:uncharacterized protein (DUF2147 family)